MSLTVPLQREPVPLTEDQAMRYLRTTLVPGIGRAGQERLLAARVLVVGAGGLGSPVLLYLAAAGVGQVTVADTDVVDATNLQRQIVHGRASVGVAKTTSAAHRIADLNADVTVRERGFLTAADVDAEVARHDLVVECSDTFDTKFLIADACARAGVPLVWGTIVGTTYQVGAFWSAPPPGFPTTTLRHLYPAAPPAGSTPSSADIGVLGAACGQAGSAMASEAIKLITGCGEPLLGRILIADVAAARWNTVEYVAAHPAPPPPAAVMPDDDLLEHPASARPRRSPDPGTQGTTSAERQP